MMTEDERYMQWALQLAELGRGQTSPNPLVGCVLVKDGEVVGQGAHLKAGTAHAEVHALRMAGDRAKGATAYVTLEPCSHHGRTPPCAGALVEAGVRRVVIAATDPDPRVNGRGVAWLRSAGIEVTLGVLKEAALRQNEAFRTRVLRGRPFVVWKCAATLDGYIATRTGHSTYVTEPAARRSVHQLRRTLAAIAVGSGTALADDPRLTVRLAEDGSEPSDRQPLRVVFDSRLRLLPTARMLGEPGRTLIYTTEAGAARSERVAELEQRGAEIAVLSADTDGRVPLDAALADLARRGINDILVEGGRTLVSALLRRRLVDKVVYYVAPKLLGGGIPALAGLDPAVMDEAVRLRDVGIEQVGDDLRLEGYPVYSDGVPDAKRDDDNGRQAGGGDGVHGTC